MRELDIDHGIDIILREAKTQKKIKTGVKLR